MVSASTGGTSLGSGAGGGGDQRKRGRGGTNDGDYEDEGGKRVSLCTLVEWVKLGSDIEFARVQTRSGPSSQRRRITRRGTVRGKLYSRDYQTFLLTSSTIVSLTWSYRTRCHYRSYRSKLTDIRLLPRPRKSVLTSTQSTSFTSLEPQRTSSNSSMILRSSLSGSMYANDNDLRSKISNSKDCRNCNTLLWCLISFVT